MAIDTSPLDRAGVSVQPGEVERLVSQALAAAVPPYVAPDPPRAWPPEEYAAFLRAGVDPGDVAPLPATVVPPEVRSAARLSSLLATALSVQAAAERLGLDASTLRRRLTGHTLFGIMVDGAWRLPLFQLTDDQRAVVPGFSELAMHLAGLHPLDVFNWFTLPHQDLVVGEDEQSLSPRDWLLAGGALAPVLGMAEELRSGE